jgi:energy-coupling factor transport system permease protein
MELRGFGKNAKRTWYSGRKFSKMDIISIAICTVLMVLSLLITFLNGSRYFNPFI